MNPHPIVHMTCCERNNKHFFPNFKPDVHNCYRRDLATYLRKTKKLNSSILVADSTQLLGQDALDGSLLEDLVHLNKSSYQKIANCLMTLIMTDDPTDLVGQSDRVLGTRVGFVSWHQEYESKHPTLPSVRPAQRPRSTQGSQLPQQRQQSGPMRNRNKNKRGGFVPYGGKKPRGQSSRGGGRGWGGFSRR